MNLNLPSGARQDLGAWAQSLDVSLEACQLLLDSAPVDLHLDTEVPVRLFGYDPARRHSSWFARPMPFFGHADLPRLIEGGFGGVVWDIATNPLRRPRSRAEQTLRNIERVIERVERYPAQLVLARTAGDYAAARSTGRMAVWIALQGGNAFAERIEDLGRIPRDAVCRITVLHLTNSRLGATSSPLKLRAGGLSAYGKEFVQAMQERRILVDLAHIHPQGFWDAIEICDPRWPVIASHTGVSGVRPHWRNLDDRQLRAIGERGGVVGIIYNSSFLAPGLWNATCADVLRHLEHVIDVAGEDCAALGSDYDGLILPPRDLPDPTHHPRLVEGMLRRRWSAERVAKILSGNWLRTLALVRP